MDDEQLAQLFHATYEELAPSFEYKTRQASAKPWAEVPANNKRLMIAVAKRVLAVQKHHTADDCVEDCAVVDSNHQLRTTVSMLNSMVLSGERHSDTSRKQVSLALNNSEKTSDEQLQAAIERVYTTLLRELADEELVRALSIDAGSQLKLEDKADILSGRIRRQLREWGWDVSSGVPCVPCQGCTIEVTITNFRDAPPRCMTFKRKTLLDCYLDALIWARERIGE